MVARRSASCTARVVAACAALVLAASAVAAFTPQRTSGDDESTLDAGVSGPAPAVACDIAQASVVWMCISTVLVLSMSPALALFESGMLRSKNSVSIVSQVMAGVIVLSVLW